MSNQNLIIFIVFIFHKTKYITKKLQNKIYMVSVKFIDTNLTFRTNNNSKGYGYCCTV